jgi:alkylated DNA repair dioxygenase AlkB/ubiquinone/menaquinone biosynthesis C-methylase UbiE
VRPSLNTLQKRRNQRPKAQNQNMVLSTAETKQNRNTFPTLFPHTKAMVLSTDKPHQEASAKFRSVLPHEPQSKENLGFIHLQGALEPKRRSEGGAFETDADKEENDQSYYWSTQEQLEESLWKILSQNYESHSLPYPVESITVLDRPPYTKVRLAYSSPRDALDVAIAWRSRKLTPADFFPPSENSDKFTFGNHPFQVTLTTMEPLPSISCWKRSNPPKFRRLFARPDENPTQLEQERAETRFVFMTGLLENKETYDDSFWNQTHHIVDAIRRLANHYDASGVGVEIFVSLKKMAHSCHIGMRSSSDAKALITGLQGTTYTWECTDGVVVERIQSGKLFLDYAAITQKSLVKSQARDTGQDVEDKREPSRPECTSTTDEIDVPGLQVVTDYVSPAEEAGLLAVLTGPQAPWAPNQTNKSQTGAVKRLVQHYGYVFDYETADVLRDRSKSGANCPPIPAIPTDKTPSSSSSVKLDQASQHHAANGRGWEVLACVVDKTRQFNFSRKNQEGDDNDEGNQTQSFPHLNQITINNYKPGEGIGSHVDTPSAFGDGLISISLGGGIVMEFRKVNSKIKKLVYLPPRSLVLMSGPARYEWEHVIVTRRTDTHNGTVLPRSLRVSLTLRTALQLDGSPLPLVQSNRFPPIWGNAESEQLRALVTPATERDHVHAVYDAIATQWHHTRGKRGVLWPSATQFVQDLPRCSVIADVGCGDGKYFPAVWNAGSYVIGTDISLPLLQTSMTSQNDEDTPENRIVSLERRQLRDRPAVAVADCMSVPLRDKSVDAAICIAVMHHLSTEERRLRCIEELARIVRVGGTINIQAWAMEQEESSRRKFAAPDVFVPFNAQPKYLDKVDAPSGNNQSASTAPGSEAVAAAAESKSVAQVYSEAYKNADFDEKKGLVVFQRYCHMYRKGELEELVERVPGVSVVESGYETGNHFVILQVLK